MNTIRRGGRPVAGFGVGVGNPLPQSAYVKDVTLVAPSISSKLSAFAGGAITSGLAVGAATAAFGEGFNVRSRLERGWKVVAATATVGGIVSAIAS